MSTFPVEPGVKLDNHILPIIIGRNSAEGIQPVSFEGTGFVIAPRVFVTCWHCVETQPPLDHFYAAVLQLDSAGYRALFLTQISQHPSRIDLAIAAVDHSPPRFLTLPRAAVRMGADVMAFGYPYSNFSRRQDGGKTLMLEPRHLEGYVTRPFRDQDRGYGSTDAYELDMPAPAGLSGAPLLKRGTSEVVGVVYGTKDVALIKQFSSIGEDGALEPEVQRVVSFGLAHYTSSLHTLCGPPTNGIPLADYLRRDV